MTLSKRWSLCQAHWVEKSERLLYLRTLFSGQSYKYYTIVSHNIGHFPVSKRLPFPFMIIVRVLPFECIICMLRSTKERKAENIEIRKDFLT